MAQIDVSPDAMHAFARDLIDFSASLKKQERALFGELDDLGATWKDEKFRQFDKQMSETTSQLDAFYKSSDRYVRYLEAKAKAGRRILGR